MSHAVVISVDLVTGDASPLPIKYNMGCGSYSGQLQVLPYPGLEGFRFRLLMPKLGFSLYLNMEIVEEVIGEAVHIQATCDLEQFVGVGGVTYSSFSEATPTEELFDQEQEQLEELCAHIADGFEAAGFTYCDTDGNPIPRT